MAWIEKKGRRFRIAYRFSGIRRVVALKSDNQRDALNRSCITMQLAKRVMLLSVYTDTFMWNAGSGIYSRSVPRLNAMSPPAPV